MDGGGDAIVGQTAFVLPRATRKADTDLLIRYLSLTYDVNLLISSGATCGS